MSQLDGKFVQGMYAMQSNGNRVKIVMNFDCVKRERKKQTPHMHTQRDTRTVLLVSHAWRKTYHERMFLVKHSRRTLVLEKKKKDTVRQNDWWSVCLLAGLVIDVCKYLRAGILSVWDSGLFQGTALCGRVCMKWHSSIFRVGQKDLLSMSLNYCSHEGGWMDRSVGEGAMCVKTLIKDTERLQEKEHIL